MEQAELLVPTDDPYEALRIIIMRLGGAKRVAKRLRPELSLDAAAIWLDNCLNRDRREKFDIDQIDLLVGWGRAIGCHAWMDCLAQRHNYHVTPVEPEDERARLYRQFIESQKALAHTLEQLERLGPIEPAPSRSVKA